MGNRSDDVASFVCNVFHLASGTWAPMLCAVELVEDAIEWRIRLRVPLTGYPRIAVLAALSDLVEFASLFGRVTRGSFSGDGLEVGVTQGHESILDHDLSWDDLAAGAESMANSAALAMRMV